MCVLIFRGDSDSRLFILGGIIYAEKSLSVMFVFKCLCHLARMFSAKDNFEDKNRAKEGKFLMIFYLGSKFSCIDDKK